MGLIHHVERDIETGTFAEMLDPDVPDWPMKEAMKFTKLALRCAELITANFPQFKSVLHASKTSFLTEKEKNLLVQTSIFLKMQCLLIP